MRHKNIDAEEFKSLIKFCDKTEYTMIAATYGKGENVDTSGIVAGHAYSLISCVDVLDNGRTVTLVKLRNPWGRGEWKGDWSDQSSKWTPELKRQVGFVDQDDGMFYMDINDYKETYAVTSLCLTNDPVKYKHSNIHQQMAGTNTQFF